MLLGISIVLFAAALLDFEALKKGKIAIVEPIYALEVPVAAILAFSVIKESVDMIQLLLISLLVIGLVLVSLKSTKFSKKIWIEKGVILAVIGSVFMGVTNFLVGFASRVTNALVVNWFISVFLTLVCLFYIMSNHRMGKLIHDFENNKKLLLSMSLLDNLAWVAFAIAMTLIPIIIAVALSESYIALAALLGMAIGKEKLLIHQKFGLCVALSCAIILAVLLP
jgi:drug/metabolite transporter (DMT)-like permease